MRGPAYGGGNSYGSGNTYGGGNSHACGPRPVAQKDWRQRALQAAQVTIYDFP